ncbi:hypothetical protein ACQKGC_25600 [Allorhizobium pseudoryzae]|jgi:methyl-accepting chemotaxis protein|uniref:hypothetical protein n=1 Tax=Allorhizobium pseudoryzae TaxID=379684 RepID=UPI003D037FA9
MQEINTAVNAMDQGTQQNAAMVEEATAASHALSQDAASLMQLLGQFNVSEPAVSFDTGSQLPTVSGSHSQTRPSPARTLGQQLASAFTGAPKRAVASLR